MIVGNGDIASVLGEVDKPNLLFFASGVSNSKEVLDSAYQREIDLLMKQDFSKHIVYFSSLSIFYNNNRYTMHKIQMERTIREYFHKWTIIRIGNITWGKNPHTIINFFRNKIKNNQPIEVRDEYRYVVELDEFLHWLKLIPTWSCEMNIPGRRMLVSQILNEYGYA